VTAVPGHVEALDNEDGHDKGVDCNDTRHDDGDQALFQ
jgi:hypothetical protein